MMGEERSASSLNESHFDDCRTSGEFGGIEACQFYKPIGDYCNDGWALPERIIRFFGVNPVRCRWLGRNLHRHDPSGTMIAYWNGDPYRSPRWLRLAEGFPHDLHELILSSSYSRQNPIPGLLPQPPAHPAGGSFFAHRFGHTIIEYHVAPTCRPSALALPHFLCNNSIVFIQMGRGIASPDDARQPTARHGGKEAAAKAVTMDAVRCRLHIFGAEPRDAPCFLTG